MKPLGLRLFAWTYNNRKVRGRWQYEVHVDRIVKPPNRGQQKRRAIAEKQA